MNWVETIKKNKRLKTLALWMLMPANQARPRRWVKWFLNPLKHKRGRNALIRPYTRMDVFPFNDFVLGADSTIEDFATINNGVGHVRIGARTRIGISCVVIGPVTIGDDVMLAQNIVLSGLNHPYEDISCPISRQKVTTKEIIVKDESWIGANAVITAGVTIGKHVVVAAGSVVTRDVPDYSVVAGNPAKIIKRYNFETRLWEKVT
ncbi:MAG: acetyltransferase [Chitinophagales bacterium]|nr:MAG: acetyltransferase [Chitinophagales bacterium]